MYPRSIHFSPFPRTPKLSSWLSSPAPFSITANQVAQFKTLVTNLKSYSGESFHVGQSAGEAASRNDSNHFKSQRLGSMGAEPYSFTSTL